jgi:hypothetical protein
MDHTVFVLVEGSCSEKPFVLLIQLVLSSRMSIVVWIGHVCSSTKTAHLETKETYSCTSTNSVRTFEKVRRKDHSVSFIRLEAFWLF